MMLREIFEQVQTIAIGGHIRPDGDCTGSCLGLYQYLKDNYPNVTVDVYLEELPDSFQFLKGADEIHHEVTEVKQYDLFVALDCGDRERLGFSKILFEHAKDTYCVDHHISNLSFARHNHIVPDASSTSELVCGLLELDKISKEAAECLYLGIVHDTGVFQYSNTAPETMEIAANLMRKGIDASSIIEKTFYEKTYAQNQILGRALFESFLFMDGACIVSCITQKMMELHGVTPKDLEGIVSQLRVTKGIEVAILMYEVAPHEFKVSLRASGNVDVSKVAQYFGGGGHKKAAGVNMKGTVHDVINNLAGQIHLQII